jgi:hypothetical protein
MTKLQGDRMKKFFAMLVLLTMGQVKAEELKFGDLNYFFQQGQFNLRSNLNLVVEESQDDGSTVEVEGYFLNNRLTYGLTDRVNLFVGVNYLYEVDTRPEGENAIKTQGLQNPNLGIDLRVLEQNESGFNFDVGSVVHVNLMDQEVGSNAPKEEGNLINPLLSNYSDPRSAIELNARLGKKWNEANEFYVLTAAKYNLKGEYDLLGETTSTVELDSSIDYRIGAFYQYRPVNEFMMTLGLEASHFGRVEGDVEGDDLEKDAHLDLQFSFVAKYLITENFIARLNFAQDRRSDFDYEIGGTSFEMKKRRSRSFGLGIDWLF